MSGRHKQSNSLINSLFTLALGAGAMWLFDPNSGRRRQAQLRDQATHYGKEIEKSARRVAEDLSHKSSGLAAQAQSMVLQETEPSDEKVVARVRSRMGRLVSHPGAIEVSAHDGRVTLSGMVLESEYAWLDEGVRQVKGVKVVENQLQVVNDPSHVPSMQGGKPRSPSTPELLREQWSPGTRFLVGSSGLWLMKKGRSWGVLGLPLTLGGAVVLMRSLLNRPVGQIADPQAIYRQITLEKTIEINAPVERVFEFWANFENLPLFLDHLHVVRKIDETTSRWTADAVAGFEISWTAETTHFDPNERISWRSLPGSMLENSGTVLFEPLDENRCRLHAIIHYTPPAGQIGHALATLLGKNPKQQMDTDLNHLKALIEKDAPELAFESAQSNSGSAANASGDSTSSVEVGDPAEAIESVDRSAS